MIDDPSNEQKTDVPAEPEPETQTICCQGIDSQESVHQNKKCCAD